MHSAEKDPWYMTTSGVLGGLAIQLVFWILCVVAGALLTVPNGDGVIVGHIIAVGCSLFGFPARLFLKE